MTAGRSVSALTALGAAEVRLANYHGLTGLFAGADDPDLNGLALFHFLAMSGRQRVMLRHLNRILHSLYESEIPVSVLKGPYIAQDYIRPKLRTFSDVDLLVPETRLQDALRVLEADVSVKDIPAKKPRADKRNIPVHDPSGLVFNLDLHWDMFSYTQLLGCADGATAWAWNQAVPDPAHPLGPLWHLPSEARIAFLSTHAVLDHRFRLILFRDLAELARKGIDGDALFEFTNRWQLRSFTYLALRIARDLADAQVNDGLLHQLRPASLVMKAVERLISRVDFVHFAGHKPHPLNLAIVLLHDSRAARVRLAMRAPLAAPQWLRRVTSGEYHAADERNKLGRRRPRILHVLPTDVARGAQTYAKAMRKELDGPEVEHRTVTVFRTGSASLEADLDLGVTYRFGRRMGFSPTAFSRLREEMRRWEPDVVVAHGGEALKYAAFATTGHTKLVYYKIGTSRGLLRNPVRRFFHRHLVSRADLVAGVSEEMVDEATTLLGTSGKNTIYIPNGRDPAIYCHKADPTDLSPVRFLFVGHMTRTKRPEVFLEAMVELTKRGVSVRGVMVGDGPLLDALRQSASEQVNFLGARDDVPQLLGDADVLLFTSTTEGEGMPGVLIEAGLAGLPVVATEVPGARTVVEDGVTGVIVPVDDTAQLMDAAEGLARQPDLRRTMGLAARQRCLDRFTLDSSVAVWQRQLAGLLLEAQT